MRAITQAGFVRLIPAHAGKTSAYTVHITEVPAHPRSRGENFLIVEVAEKLDGSSPLTRGKPHDLGCHVGDPGLIPAHAGKTRRLTILIGCIKAHPRSRGENPVTRPRRASVLGSSPLTRGKLNPAHRRRERRRLIPAHAGKTLGTVMRCGR